MESYEEFEAWWRSEFPEEVEWFHFSAGEDQKIGNLLQSVIGDEGHKVGGAVSEAANGRIEPAVAPGVVKHPKPLTDLTAFGAGRKPLHTKNDLSDAGLCVLLGKINGLLHFL